MTTIQAANTGLVREAARLGIELPRPIATLSSPILNVLDDPHRVADEVAEEIVGAIGSRSFPATRDAALDRLARARAGRSIQGVVSGKLDKARWAAVVAHADEIIGGFREALASDFRTLTEYAPLVPVSADEEATLPPDAYRARFEALAAAKNITPALTALAPLYGVQSRPSTLLIGTQLPKILDGGQAAAANRALHGLRIDLPTSRPGLWWAGLAAQGATFDLSTRDDFRAARALVLSSEHA